MEPRKYAADASTSLPDMTTLTSTGYPTEGNPQLGISATKPGAAWFYGIGEEIRNVIVAAGLTPGNTSVDQMASAINLLIASSVSPTGIIIPFSGSTVPDGYLLANGAAVSRTTYADLYAVIGDTYGDGDGSTTFNVPDMRDRYPIGVGTNILGTKVAEQLPNIIGNLNHVSGDMPLVNTTTSDVTDGAFSIEVGSKRPPNAGNTSSQWCSRVHFKASDSNSIYTNSGKVRPLSLALNFIIKS